MPTQQHKTTIQNQSKFISKNHIGYSENVALDILQESQYRLQNITHIQVADVQVALQICRVSENRENQTIPIHTLDKAIKDIKTQDNSSTAQDESQNLEIHTNIQTITPPNGILEILDLRAMMAELASLLYDENSKKENIEAILQRIKDILNAYQKQDTLFDTMKDVDFSQTKKAFNDAQEVLKEISTSLDTYANEAKKDFENRFNKDIIALSAQVIKATHLPLLAHILAHKVGTDVAKKILFAIILGGAALGPFGITLSIVFVLLDIYDFFANKKKENEKLKAAYEVYGAIMSIYKQLDYSLASLINFGHIGAGNLITTKNNSAFTYSLYPNYIGLDSKFLPAFLEKNTLRFTDISYRATLSLYNQQELEQSYLQNIFTYNNSLENATIHTKTLKTQFSTFSFEHMCKIYEEDKDNNFTHSSAFTHLHNMLLGFDNFLFIKSSSFSSAIVSDMFIQSFAPSKQQDNPRIHKTALILTNCLHNGLPQYQVQQHIKDKIFHHENMKKNILFLSAMYRVKKTAFVAELIDTLIGLFNKLEQYAYYNQTQQTRYLIDNLGALIKKYDVGDVKYIGYGDYVASYRMSDKKLCNMNERDFCSFVYDVCQVFVTKKHATMSYDYMNNKILRAYWYGGNQEKLQQAKAQIQKTFTDIMTIISDIGKLFSHFNTYELNRFKEYNEQIQTEYKKQKDAIQKFFNTESFQNKQGEKQPNIFYKIQAIQVLCMAVLDRYFNKKGDTKDLDSLLQSAKGNIKIPKSEQALEQSNKVAYYQITKEYVIPLLPLDTAFFNCLEEEDIFLCTRSIIQILSTMQGTTQDKNERQKAISNFIATYETTIGLYTLMHDEDFEKLYYESMVESHDKTMQNIIKAFCGISTEASKKIAKDILTEALKKKFGDKYGVIPAIIFEKDKEKILQKIGSNIAKELDKPYTKHLPSTNLPQNLKRFSFVANAAISYATQAILDTIFPTHIGSVRDMKQQAIALLFALNRHTNTPYATCKQGSEYLTFPIEITQTLLSADLQAMIIGGSALNSGLCVHTPSVAIFNENKENALKALKETLRYFMNAKVDFSLLDGKKRTIVKEAYAKLWYYLDMGKNEEIESYLRNKLCVKPSYYTLENLTSDRYIHTKLKKAKNLNNDDENFIEVKRDKTGGIRFNHDFLIQLKRVAEWNYEVYTNKVKTQRRDDNGGKPKEPQLCGNLIYNEGYIPTTIDIKD